MLCHVYAVFTVSTGRKKWTRQQRVVCLFYCEAQSNRPVQSVARSKNVVNITVNIFIKKHSSGRSIPVGFDVGSSI